jgi:hypothetical protein
MQKAIGLVCVVLLASAGVAVAASAPLAKGKGRAGNVKFSFKYKSGAGRMELETISFGVLSGSVGCYASLGRLAVLSGVLDVPSSGLTHFLLAVEDHKNLGGPDEFTSWLSTSAYDCVAELVDPDPDSLVSARDPIERGGIVVKPEN